MSAERIDGIKYHLDREPAEVLVGMRGHLLERHRALVDDIEKVSGELAVRGVIPPLEPANEVEGQLPFAGLEDPFRVDL